MILGEEGLLTEQHLSSWVAAPSFLKDRQDGIPQKREATKGFKHLERSP